MKNMLKDAVILLIITVIAGASLGFVYSITKEPIKEAEAKTKEKAYKEVFESAESFDDYSDFTNPETSDSLKWNSEGFDKVEIKEASLAKDKEGSVQGVILSVVTHEGFGGDIEFAMGIMNDGTLNGISILKISETPGLGMRANDVLKPQYQGKKVDSFLVTKTGSSSDNEIDAISGATITSKALTKAVNAGLYYFNNYIGGGLNEE